MAKKVATKARLAAACKAFFNQPSLKATNKIIAAARSYRRQLRKASKQASKKVSKKTSKKAA